MCIAYLVNTYPMGSHSFIRREIRALERCGAKVLRIAVRGWHETHADAEDRDEQRLTHYVLRDGLLGLSWGVLTRFASGPVAFLRAACAAVRLSRMSDRSLAHHLVYLAEACRVLQLSSRHGVSHLHAHFGTNSAEVAMLARILGGPKYSFTVHGPEEFDKPAGLHLREKVAHAQFVVAVSSFGRSQMFRWVPYEQWGKVKVIHCGLEPSFDDDRLTPPSGLPRLVCVGRLCEQKGQLLLLEAAEELVRRGTEFELVLAGDGEMRGELERQIVEKGLQRFVRLTGWLSGSEVKAELRAARALVLPSFAEGLPVVIMEAMALGRPVLTTTVAGIPELVRHGKEGWLVSPGDSQSLADAWCELLAADGPTLARMGHSARERVLQRHSVDREALRLVQLFRAAA
jgi:colanic acid/amylovoran biosynthesis glycosyltransferase